MIRVNLLPVRQAQRREMGKKQLILLALLILGAGVGNWKWVEGVNTRLSTKQAQVAQLQRDIAQLEKVIGEVNTISKEMKSLEEKLAVLDQLRQGRSGPVKFLDALATVMPEKVWMLSVTEKEKQITIKGAAVSNDDLADFMRALKDNPYFSEPTLRRSVQKGSGDNRTVEFELSCRVNYSV